MDVGSVPLPSAAETPHGIHDKRVACVDFEPKLKHLTQIANDEFYLGKSVKYLTVVLDLESGAIVFVGRKKGAKALDPFWKRLRHSWAVIEAVAADLSPAHALMQRYSQAEKIHVVLDNYAIHTTKLVQESLATPLGRKLRLHFLPPYGPDHNRIERTWEDLHANVTRNHQCSTMPHLMRNVRSCIRRHNHRRPAAL